MLPQNDAATSTLKDANGNLYTQVPDVSDANYWSVRKDEKNRSTHYVPIDKELHRQLLRKDYKPKKPKQPFQPKAYIPLKRQV